MSLNVAQDFDYQGENLWKWWVWIEGPAEELDDIKNVTYILHPSFANPVRTVDDRASNFKLKSQGWGIFVIRINVLKKDGSTIGLTHELHLAASPPDEHLPSGMVSQAEEKTANTPSVSDAEQDFRSLAEQYEEIRRSLPIGDARTRKMEAIAAKGRSIASTGLQFLERFTKSPSAGERLLAVSILEEIPDPRYLTWLAERVKSEKPFIGYHATRALLEAARTLDSSHRGEIQEAIRMARNHLNQLDWKDPNQVATLERAEQEVANRK